MLAIVIDARDNWKSTVPRVGKRLPDLMTRLLLESRNVGVFLRCLQLFRVMRPQVQNEGFAGQL